MKSARIVLLVAVPFAFVSCLMQQGVFRELKRLEGSWMMKTQKGLLYENWALTSESELRSKSFKVTGNDTTILEHVQLIERKDGIFYIPVVENQNNRQAVSFKLVESAGNRYVFENKLHDYPQRIIYNLIRPDSLVARIEGEKNGQTRGSNFYFVRQ
jgi:hypothetical protein